MCRPRRLSAGMEARIGAALARARAEGVCWKLLMRRYGLGRTKLYELWRAQLAREAAGRGDKDVREHPGAGQTAGGSF